MRRPLSHRSRRTPMLSASPIPPAVFFLQFPRQHRAPLSTRKSAPRDSSPISQPATNHTPNQPHPTSPRSPTTSRSSAAGTTARRSSAPAKSFSQEKKRPTNPPGPSAASSTPQPASPSATPYPRPNPIAIRRQRQSN